MFRPGEDADEPSEHELEAALGLLRLKLRDGWLFSDYERQVGDEIDHQPSVRAKRLQKGIAPTRQLGVALAEQRSHKTMKSLHQRRVGDVPFELVELP